MSEIKVSQEDMWTRECAWRGVAAGMASRSMANRALSWGAKTNGAAARMSGFGFIVPRTSPELGTPCAVTPPYN
jgi:hypothetical protein